MDGLCDATRRNFRQHQCTQSQDDRNQDDSPSLRFGTGAVDSSASQNSKQRNNPGYGYVLNRDKITVAGGTYAGNGNRGVHPLGKMVELVGGRGENVVIDCEDSGVGATVSAGDRHATDVAGAIAIANVLEVNCNQRLA